MYKNPIIQPVLLTYNNYLCVIRRLKALNTFESKVFQIPLVIDNSKKNYFENNSSLLNEIKEKSSYVRTKGNKNACDSILNSIDYVKSTYYWFLGDDYPIANNQDEIISIIQKNKPDQIFFNYSYENEKIPVRKFYKSNLFINNFPNFLRKFFIFRRIGLNAGFVPGYIISYDLISKLQGKPFTDLLPLKLSLISEKCYFSQLIMFEAGNYSPRMKKEKYLDVFFEDFIEEVHLLSLLYWQWLLRSALISTYNYKVDILSLKKRWFSKEYKEFKNPTFTISRNIFFFGNFSGLILRNIMNLLKKNLF